MRVRARQRGWLRPAVVLVIVLSASLALRAVPRSHASAAPYSPVLMCGSQRWLVKTLQDRPRLIPARPTTIASLVGLPRPRPVPRARLPFERRIYAVTAAVTFVRAEADQDLHVVIESGGKKMIAESPAAPGCTVNATRLRRKQMAQARTLVRLCARARIVGVAFWDFKHRQTGVAPNAIELHPILGFACLR